MESDVTNEENDVEKEETAVTKEEGSPDQEENSATKEEDDGAKEENSVVEEESTVTPAVAEEESAGNKEESVAVEQDSTKPWYVIHAYSGFENKVKLSLEERFAHAGLTDKLGDIVIPTEEVVEIRGGKRRSALASFIRVMF